MEQWLISNKCEVVNEEESPMFLVAIWESYINITMVLACLIDSITNILISLWSQLYREYSQNSKVENA